MATGHGKRFLIYLDILLFDCFAIATLSIGGREQKERSQRMESHLQKQQKALYNEGRVMTKLSNFRRD
jgi:hypothetical protein